MLLKNKIFSKFLMILTITMSVIISFNAPQKNVFAENDSEIVMEVSSGKILFGHNIDEKKYMASTTKIMTALIVLENCKTDDFVTVGKKTVGVEGSSIYLEAGEVLTVKDLLYGLMLRSGNDCAETLAVFCAGSIDAFAQKMNQKAFELGAFNTHFVNPHGLHDDNHYTTARDLAIISCYAIKNPVFKEIVSTKKTVIPFTTRNIKRVLINKNKMLNNLEGATGIKTGYTKKAGRCLVSSCERNGMELVSVVLNCPPMFERSEYLLNSCFDKYKLYKIIKANDIVDFIPVINSSEKSPIYSKNDVNLPLTEQEYNNLKVVYKLPETLTLPVICNSVVGEIEFYIENNLIYTEKLYNMINI